MRRGNLYIAFVTAALGAGLLATPTFAAPSPFRGSLVSYQNTVSALTFDEGADLTYNPYHAMSLTLRPQWFFFEPLYVNAGLSLSRETTHSDETTFADETVLGDVTLGLGASNFVTIPGAEIAISAGVDFAFPSSKVSQARTLYVGITPKLSLSRTFDVLAGIHLGYSFSATGNLHAFTTSERETALIPGCAAAANGCGEYLNTGLRNVSWRFQNRFSLAVDFVEQFGLSVSFGMVHDKLYDLPAASDAVTHQQLAGTDWRYVLAYGVEATVRPIGGFSIGIGASTINPQKAPDNSEYLPFFNRNTALYLDLRFDVAGLVATLSPAPSDSTSEVSR